MTEGNGLCMPEETNPVWDKVAAVRDGLTDIEREVLEYSWQYWISNSTLIKKKKLAGYLKDNCLIASILDRIPAIIKLVDRDQCSVSSDAWHVVTPTLLGTLCMSNWREIHGIIKLLIETASIAYSPDSDNNVMESGFLQTKYGLPQYTPSTALMMQYVAALLPEWRMQVLQDRSWKVWFPENISDVAFKSITVDEYVSSILEEMFRVPKVVETHLLLLDNVVSRVFYDADELVRNHAPSLLPRINAITECLDTNTVEHWSDAVHSIRKLLHLLADMVFPATKVKRRIKGKEISLGPANYIGRLKCFIDDNCDSSRYVEVFGSNIELLGKRLDAINKAANKGTHAEIYNREEAETYVVYGYLIIRDVLMLYKNNKEHSQ